MQLTPRRKSALLSAWLLISPFADSFSASSSGSGPSSRELQSDRTGIAGQSEACRIHNTLERLSSITAPTLVIVGTGDRIIKPVSSEVIAGKIPNAKLVKVEVCNLYIFIGLRTLNDAIIENVSNLSITIHDKLPLPLPAFLLR
jgi:pimeloyl-ACP methyl ester carboxylesterase